MDHVGAAGRLHLDFAGDRVRALRMDDRSLRRSQKQGSAVRVRRGVYASAAEWRSASSCDRHIAQIIAVAATRHGVVVGYESAAAFWGFPRLGHWPSEVQLVSRPGSGAHSRAGVREHRVALPDDDVVEVDGIRITTPARTLIDVARSGSTLDAVVMIDHALNPMVCHLPVTVEQRELLELAGDRVGRRGRSRVLAAIGASRVGSANPGETWGRLLIERFGMPEPCLQVQHVNPRGGFYYTDFEWPELSIIGEFDGRSKYLKPEYLGALTPGEAVVAEKIREDHLRLEGSRVVRWMFDGLRDPSRLRDILTAVGVPARRARESHARRA
ncbi:hypothetical protein B7R22_12545 [Subtercola boreus]|uniref:AbiEi antitoxin C-terminal domain-containing protein n=1 Tax=Subtercola boreus TaxID=120213 RepID=A0A3E0VTY7_9MICO|nr:hypothetical protein [Subtercola boreus]RFA13494.1 hypothetical protein B7R22_12545 [Subtercola boreus]